MNMKRAFATLIVLLFMLSAAFAQENDSDWFWNKPISSVQWEGIRKANRNELDALMKSYIGQQFTEDLWLTIQARLYELDWFETIEPQAVPANSEKSTMILKFIVKEKPSVQSVKVAGNSAVRTSEILNVISIKGGEIFNSTKANQDDAAILKLYIEKGYPDAVVSHQTQADQNDPSQLVLIFQVTEGSQVALRSIKFTGNASVSEKSLKAVVTLKEAALFQPGIFQEDKLEESRKLIIDYYQSKGFVDAKVLDVFREIEKDPDTGKNWLNLTFSISEGKQWKFGGIEFSGNEVFDNEKLKSLVSQKPGSILNYKKLLQDKQKIDDLYYESGYIFNQISMKDKRDEASQSITYQISVVERDRAHIESLKFKGNEKTKEFVLAREMPLEEGDIFSKSKIIEGLRNLYNLQYFSTVEPQISQGSAENLMDLVINVEEMSTADIQFGITLSGLGQTGNFPLSGFVKWNDRNLGGTGQNLAVNATVSPTEQSLDTSFGESWLFGKRISRSFGLNFTHNSQTTGQDILAPIFSSEDIPDPFTSLGGTNGWNGSISSIPSEYLMPYDNYSMSLSFNAGYTMRTALGDLGVSGGISSGLGMISFDESKYRPYEKEMRETNNTWLLTNKLFAKLNLNNLDFWYNPSRGYFASQRFTLAGFLGFERQHYIKSESKLDAYLKLFSIPLSETWKFSWVLAGHTGYQMLLAQPWTALSVTKDWISLDGTFNARGWKELYGTKGTDVWENSLELRMPIVDQMLWMDLFVDAGAMKTPDGWLDMTLSSPAASASAFGWKNFAFSTGLGFRFIVPQFPFRFYLVKRFTFDGSAFSFKTAGANFDFVLSITQPLY